MTSQLESKPNVYQSKVFLGMQFEKKKSLHWSVWLSSKLTNMKIDHEAVLLEYRDVPMYYSSARLKIE